MHLEVHDLLNKNAIRRDVTVASTGNTYRKMYNVNQPEIKQNGELIALLYESPAVRNFLGDIARDGIVSCWEQEQYLITKLSHPGDTHGWHWGDYPYTMIWIIEAPEDPAIGGVLQCVPHTEWDKQDPQIWEYILTNDVKSYHHLKGDVYFLKSDTTLHHFVPIQQETTDAATSSMKVLTSFGALRPAQPLRSKAFACSRAPPPTIFASAVRSDDLTPIRFNSNDGPTH